MKKILYVASVASHLRSFHIPYINALRADGYEVVTLAAGEGAVIRWSIAPELPGALELCRELYDAGCILSIATNGVARVQHARMDTSPLRPYISHLFISEEQFRECGFKPDCIVAVGIKISPKLEEYCAENKIIKLNLPENG